MMPWEPTAWDAGEQHEGVVAVGAAQPGQVANVRPAFESFPLARIDVLAVRTWLAKLEADGVGQAMDRLGHSTTVAAVRYQHVMADRDAAIARELNRLVEGG
jgi:hypothetical protein